MIERKLGEIGVGSREGGIEWKRESKERGERQGF